MPPFVPGVGTGTEVWGLGTEEHGAGRGKLRHVGAGRKRKNMGQIQVRRLGGN